MIFTPARLSGLCLVAMERREGAAAVEGDAGLVELGGEPAGVRYDDPAFGIAWPQPVGSISPRDAAWPDHRRAHETTSA